jgi:hypothetical protein
MRTIFLNLADINTKPALAPSLRLSGIDLRMRNNIPLPDAPCPQRPVQAALELRHKFLAHFFVHSISTSLRHRRLIGIQEQVVTASDGFPRRLHDLCDGDRVVKILG